jgi:hypothetical protein
MRDKAYNTLDISYITFYYNIRVIYYLIITVEFKMLLEFSGMKII